MTARPIIFQGWGVRAIGAGTKTQTRRLRGLEDVNGYPGRLEGDSALGPLGYRGLLPGDYYNTQNWRTFPKRDFVRNPGLYHWFLGEQDGEANPIPVKCPYGKVGDQLWVQETWFNNLPEERSREHIYYRADDDDPDFDGETIQREGGGWRPSIFMRREYSRYLLELRAVRAERLARISPSDAIAEGMPPYDPAHRLPAAVYYVAAFRDTWAAIHGRNHTWESNPFVWVLDFRKIDAL